MIVLGKKSKLMGRPIQDGSMLLAILMSKFMLKFGMLNMPKIKILLVIEIFFGTHQCGESLVTFFCDNFHLF